MATFAPSSQLIKEITFNSSGSYFGSYDVSNHVMLFKKTGQGVYEYLGRALAHFSSIIGIEFCLREGLETLISIGEDR